MAQMYELGCSFCDESFRVPADWPLEKALEWIEVSHLGQHVEEMAGMNGSIVCARCARYEVAIVPPTDTLHRKCFDVRCYCPCSRMMEPASAE